MFQGDFQCPLLKGRSHKELSIGACLAFFEPQRWPNMWPCCFLSRYIVDPFHANIWIIYGITVLSLKVQRASVRHLLIVVLLAMKSQGWEHELKYVSYRNLQIGNVMCKYICSAMMVTQESWRDDINILHTVNLKICFQSLKHEHQVIFDGATLHYSQQFLKPYGYVWDPIELSFNSMGFYVGRSSPMVFHWFFPHAVHAWR